MNLNIDFVRSQFPALAGEWVFLDNAGGSQTVRQVADKIHDYLLSSDVQLGASYDVSQLAGQRVKAGAQTAAQLVNASDESEVILGSSTTMLMRLLSFSLVETFKPGDEIIVTNCDHEANIGPWKNLEKRGMVIKTWRLNPETLELHLEDLGSLMTEKTRLVALTHASNILGTINPIKKIASFIHGRGALVCVDGVAYAPHALPDVRDLDVDFYAFSFYKVYGPHYAVLYGKKAHLLKMPGLNHFFINENDIPYKFQPGSPIYELSYGVSGIGDYFYNLAKIQNNQPGNRELKCLRDAAALAYECFAMHEERLSARLLDFLNSKPNVRIIGKKESNRSLRMPTISFVIDGVKSSTIPPEVDKHKIGIRFGDFYARRLIEDLGLALQDGVVRVSMVHYNTFEEMDRLIKVFQTLF
ncbi:MAG: cysteine desulfurase-like protein [Acidobacteria bacterium]|jgi:cysteine desulfurase family protein (TIGR01976 family)|nr:cysteine desulfurase-like protein [Acidobacteriota bacterium]